MIEDQDESSHDATALTARRHFYGRRHGPGLSVRQQALLDTRLPPLLVPLPDVAAKLDPRALLPFPATEVWMEIGFGGGEHLALVARQHPEIGFIGCEPFVNGIAKLLGEIERLGLTNIRLYDDDALLLIDALAPASLGRIYLLHPDPWPKRKHWKRRFVNDANLDRLARVLRPGGELRFTSDHAGYVQWTRKHLARRDDFALASEGTGVTADEAPEQHGDDGYKVTQTRYGEKAHKEGRERVHLRLVRR